MRNLIIHRGGLDFSNGGIGNSNFYISGGSKEQQILRDYLGRIGVEDSIYDVDLASLCKHQWGKLSELIEDIMNKSKQTVNVFLSTKQTEISKRPN